MNHLGIYKLSFIFLAKNLQKASAV